MSTPLLYNKITPNIKKPLLACLVFVIGFLAYSALIILPYHYGIAVPKKEGIFALSSFIILFVIYTFFTYDSYAGFKFPYFIQKYLIDQNLRHDLEDNLPVQMRNAKILEIQLSSKSIYALKLASDDLRDPEWFYVNLNLMFPKLYFFYLIKLENSCIGQTIDFEYLPESKVILNLCASDLETDFSTINGSPFFCAVPKTLKQIPSQFLLDFLKISSINVKRLADTIDYELICKTANHTHHIKNTTQGFSQLEQALADRIDWSKYDTFKTQPSINESNISK